MLVYGVLSCFSCANTLQAFACRGLQPLARTYANGKNILIRASLAEIAELSNRRALDTGGDGS